MSKEKRYNVIIDMDIYAENDLEAKFKAAELAEKLDDELDNDAQVVELYKRDFGSLVSKTIHKGPLRTFEGRLIT